MRTAIRLIDEIPHLVPYIRQLPEEENTPVRYRPAMIFRQENWRLWRFVNGTWRDYGPGRVDVFRESLKTALRFLARGTYRQLLTMVLSKHVAFCQEPVHRGVMLCGPGIDAVGKVSFWTLILRRTHEEKAEPEWAYSDEYEWDKFARPPPKDPAPDPEKWNIRKKFRLPGEGEDEIDPRLRVPSFQKHLEASLKTSERMSHQELQLQASRVLIHTLDISKCKRYSNTSTVNMKGEDKNSKGKSKNSLRFTSTTDSDRYLTETSDEEAGDFDESDGSSSDPFKHEDRYDKQRKEKHRIFYKDFGGMIPGAHIYNPTTPDGEDDFGKG
eukprot:CAMPEP_0197536984 /NCGR_PEP_ID=MMETSP1318-20131121/55495_1 /TAXON_ID=552666 /ORGANISM="Partenskyella glossopodia, Strain RCC365" /LENGTH=326 /DNA_ID=CAMNT_0043095027 /DNA_START=8 /DNA_END=984 /DNA_ORIENTATION=+